MLDVANACGLFITVKETLTFFCLLIDKFKNKKLIVNMIAWN